MSGRRRWPAILMALGGVACVTTGIVLVLEAPHPAAVVPIGTVPSVHPRSSPQMSGTASVGLPAGTAIVPAHPVSTVPIQVELPERGVDAPVVPVHTSASGALAAPDPPTTIGWWAAGARIGDATGNLVLVGHMDSRTGGIGTFAVLPALRLDETVSVRGADGYTTRYRVVARRQFPKAAIPADLFTRAGPSRLVLITCGGRFDRERRSYQDNVVVYALPVESPR